ncbi:hypothetical protein [Flindersiella endophytica]
MPPSMVSAGRPDDRPFGPPAWEIPGLVPAERIVTGSDDIVVTVGPVRVYSTGLLLAFHVLFRPDGEYDADAFQDDLLELLEGVRPSGADQLVLRARSNRSEVCLDLLHGRSRDSEWSLTYWLHPAPAGDLKVLAGWPRRQVPEGEATLTGEELRAAGAAVRRLG